ncbi:centriolin-like [Scleropages formosus]|uniref:centriolin-like n=1 Tax=Scleropages formosus TaxID=113540 RepID=UPI0010FA6CE5|nr:centriolin-like [Scleropages formosus]
MWECDGSAGGKGAEVLKNLTELVLAENPVSNLPHYRLFLVFHLRALEKLDGLPVSVQERNIAHQRFHMEEVEHLEQELESQLAVIEKLREEQTATLQELEKQETLNRNLQLQNREQQSCQAQLERELETKNELVHTLSGFLWGWKGSLRNM